MLPKENQYVMGYNECLALVQMDYRRTSDNQFTRTNDDPA